MKIVCDSCSTKYSISDDKVRGKVFKIRCKKCSHIIVVKGASEPAGAAPEPAAPEASWHLVVEGDQVGPLSDADVRARLARGEISVENYVWKEGFSDWLRLADVAEFSDVAPSVPVGGEMFSESGNASHDGPTEIHQPVDASGSVGGFFGSSSVGGDADRSAPTGASLSAGLSASLSGRHSSPSMEAAAPVEDAFSAPPGHLFAAEGGGADLFGAAAPVPSLADSGRVRGRGTNGTVSGRHDGGRVETLTAQRSENSVLFSLSNLQSLAAPNAGVRPPSTTQTTEGSGLIDIRAMAASTLRPSAAGGGAAVSFGGASAKSGEDDLPTFGAFSSAAPVLLPLPSSSGPPKWVYLLVGLAVVLIIAVGVAAFSILNRPVMVEQAAPPPAPAVAAVAAAPAAGEAKAAPGSEAKTTIAAGDLPPREGAETAPGEKPAGDKTAFAKTGKKGKGRKGAGTGDGKAAAAGAATAAAASAEAAEPDKAKPAKGSLDDLLEGALNGRKSRARVDDDAPGSGKRSSAASSDTGSGGGGPLAKSAVVGGMNGIKGKISACYAQFKVPGLAMVNVVIGKSGKVTSAAVTGKFAGTPTGTCVEAAVKSASFPPSDGLTTPYPFSLR